MQPDLIFKKIQKNRKRSVHFIGIGGIGLSSVARWFLAEKWAVTGSDMEPTPITRELAKKGVKVTIGHVKGLPKGTDLVIRSQAIRPDNKEYKAALGLDIPVMTYPEMVGVLTRRYKTIAVAGAHGKSTTTSLASLIAVAGGLDPTVVVGTKLKEFKGSNFRKGESGWLILEADEFGRAFLNYSPAVLLVTNIDREHLDIYKNLTDIKNTFLKLMRRVETGGTLVLNGDDKNLLAIKSKIQWLAKKLDLKILWYSLKQRGTPEKIKKILQIPGRHNLSNAMGAYALARALNIPETTILKSISTYTGSWRRFEFKGKYKKDGVEYQVFDDYAHHPVEIKATLESFREKFPGALLICVFQAHQAERLKRLFKEFQTAFGNADAVLFFPEYTVTGREEKPSPFTAKALSLAVKKKNSKKFVEYVPNPKYFSRQDIDTAVKNSKRKSKNAVVIMMGAGSIVNYTKQLLD